MSGQAGERTVVVTGTESGAVAGLPTALAEAADLTVVSVGPDGLGDELAGADAVVVVDNPPAVDGIETFRRVRADGWTCPVVLVGTAVAPDRVEAALSAGVTEYLGAWSADRAPELAARIRAHLHAPVLDGAVEADRWERIVGGVAHDIKNPLNVVSGRLELLDIDEIHSDAIERSIGRVETLLGELSAVAAVTGPIEGVESVDLAETARHVWADIGGGSDRLSVDASRAVAADRDCLELVLERLLENAIDHAGADATVTVGQTGTGFYVADDGPGIQADEPAEVFEQGYGTTPDGEGYGLFVAARAAATQGWAMTAGTSDDGGARFDVRTQW